MLQTPPYFTQLLTMKQLNPDQRYELIEQYVEILIDNMDRDHLAQIVTDSLINHYQDVSNSELKESVDLYNSELYAELVDNITTTDPIVYNTNRGQS